MTDLSFMDPQMVDQLYQKGAIGDDTMQQLKTAIDPALVDAVVKQESGGNPNAVSPKGAQGKMQLMPATAAEMAQELGMDPAHVDIHDPAVNVALGTHYLEKMQAKYGDDRLALAAYNAGPGRVDAVIRAIGSNDPDQVLKNLPAETQHYVPKVLANYAANKGAEGAPEAAAPQMASAAQPGLMQRASDFLVPPAEAQEPPTGAPVPATGGPAAVAQDQAAGQILNQYAAPQTAAPQTGATGSWDPAPVVPQPTSPLDRQAQIDKGFDSQQAAALEQVQETQQTQGALNEQYGSQQKMLATQAQAELQQRQVEQEAIQHARSVYQEASDGLASAKIEPNRVWNNMSTPQKILAGISIFLGGLGAGMTGSGKNPALEVIENAINRDVEGQKAQLQVQERNVATQGQLYTDLISQTGSDRQAREALRALQWEAAKNQVQALSENLKSEQQKGQALRLIGEMEVKRQEAQANLDKAAKEDPGTVAPQMKAVTQGTQDVSTLPEKVQERYVPGYGFAGSSDDAKQIKSAKTAMDGFNSKVDQLIQLRTQYGSETFPTQTKAKMQALRAAALADLKQIYKFRGSPEGQMKEIGDLLPDVTQWSFGAATQGLAADTVLEKLQQTREQTEKDFKSDIANRITQPTAQATNAAKGSVKVSVYSGVNRE